MKGRRQEQRDSGERDFAGARVCGGILNMRCGRRKWETEITYYYCYSRPEYLYNHNRPRRSLNNVFSYSFCFHSLPSPLQLLRFADWIRELLFRLFFFVSAACFLPPTMSTTAITAAIANRSIRTIRAVRTPSALLPAARTPC